jgi:hypothetical protein
MRRPQYLHTGNGLSGCKSKAIEHDFDTLFAAYVTEYIAGGGGEQLRAGEEECRMNRIICCS